MRSPLRTESGETIVQVGEERVVVAYDPDGEGWYVRTSSVPGLRAEAVTLEELAEALPALIRQAAVP